MKENELKEKEPVQKEQVKEKKKKSHQHDDKLLKENEQLTNQNKDLNDKVLRLTAEMQNMRRHFDEDKSRLLKYDGEKLIIELLSVIDNFERAILLDDANLTDEVSKFLSGFKMIYASLIDIFNKMEVKEIECLNKPFDCNTMNAVLMDHEDGIEPGIVIDVMQKGYMYKDKVIRPAMVKVNE